MAAIKKLELTTMGSTANRLLASAVLMTCLATPGHAQLKTKLGPPTIIVRAGEDLQKAIDAAPAAAVLELEAKATWIGNYVARRQITIQTRGLELPDRTLENADRERLASIVSPNAAPAFDIPPGVNDVRLQRVRLAGSSNDILLIGHGDASQTTREQLPQRVTVDQVLVEGTGSVRNGLGLHAGDVTITRNRLLNIKRAGIESHGIVGWNGSGPYRIERNYIQAASVDIMFGGADPSIPGLIVADVTVRGNVLTTDSAWRGQGFAVKNAFELKAARQVRLVGNTLEQVWREAQSGWAVMLTPSQLGNLPQAIVEDVTIEDNVIRDVGAGVDLIGFGQNSVTERARGIVIRRNWITTDSATYGGQGWAFFLGREPADVTIEQNTLELKAGNQILVQEGPPITGFRFVGNLVPRSGMYGFTGRAADGSNQHRAVKIAEYFPGGVITGNAFGSFPRPANLPNNLHLASSAMRLLEGHGTGALESYGRPR